MAHPICWRIMGDGKGQGVRGWAAFVVSGSVVAALCFGCSSSDEGGAGVAPAGGGAGASAGAGGQAGSAAGGAGQGLGGVGGGAGGTSGAAGQGSVGGKAGAPGAGGQGGIGPACTIICEKVTEAG